MKQFVLLSVLALIIASPFSIASTSTQISGEEVNVEGNSGGDRSDISRILVFRTAASLDVYIFGYTGSVSVSVENEAGLTVASASTVSLADGRMSLPLPVLTTGSYRVVIVAGVTYTGFFDI